MLILTYVIAFAVFIVIDLIWLGVVAKDFYGTQLGDKMAKKINWTAALIFYFLYILGLMVLVIVPALQSEAVFTAFTMGAFVSFMMYATYDLTNLATMEGWPLKMTIVDMIWGTVLGSLTSGITVTLVLALGGLS
jgi:uncharacterized membrane protein